MPDRCKACRAAALLAVAAALPVGGVRAGDLPGDPLAQDYGNPGFLLTPAERGRIRDAEAAARRETVVRKTAADDAAGAGDDDGAPRPPLTPVYVSAILRLSEGTWTVWLDRTRLTPRTQANSPFTVRWIGDNRVRLTWEPADRRTSYTFTLGPKQSFVPATGRVVDGRAEPPAPAPDAAAPPADGTAQQAQAEGGGDAEP